jgi:hypothetical protein
MHFTITVRGPKPGPRFLRYYVRAESGSPRYLTESGFAKTHDKAVKLGVKLARKARERADVEQTTTFSVEV